MTGVAAGNPGIANSDAGFANACVPAIRRICHAAGAAVGRIRADYSRARYLASGGAAVKPRFLQRLNEVDALAEMTVEGPTG